ncbi:hypothetical protein M124_2888 [Bacteroides fragilis str. 3988T(B)14]|uniref:Transmembrane protein n=1 Tax=Bacteroides fragilis str. 3988T(B)14 TaxID=1339315 RepID=A0A015SMA9_BACFG|nr:hypothetical protein M124_2888 [Bacteroides fragilis str. 3988T(B)14]EXY79312.1 hypothetical protein M084_2952 [Bacteroides fragilis str. 3988 T1]
MPLSLSDNPISIFIQYGLVASFLSFHIALQGEVVEQVRIRILF